jgi:hypothetical protein
MKKNVVIVSLSFLVPLLLLFAIHAFDIFIYIVYSIVVFPFLLIKFIDKKHRLFYFISFYRYKFFQW